MTSNPPLIISPHKLFPPQIFGGLRGIAYIMMLLKDTPEFQQLKCIKKIALKQCNFCIIPRSLVSVTGLSAC